MASVQEEKMYSNTLVDVFSAPKVKKTISTFSSRALLLARLGATQRILLVDANSEMLILMVLHTIWLQQHEMLFRGEDSSIDGVVHDFFVMKREKGTSKRCPLDVIKTMTKDTDQILQGYNSRGA